MNGLFALEEAYYFNSKILPCILYRKSLFNFYLDLAKPFSYFLLFECFDEDFQSQLSSHSSNDSSEELFSSQLRRQS